VVINSNISAITAARFLSASSDLLAKSLARLSSGPRIVSPADDAAGLAVSMRFDAQENRITAASGNVNNAISFNQTQDGFLQKVGKALDRMSELSMLAQDGTKTTGRTGDLGLYNKEFQKLSAYINDLARKDFNGVSLFSGKDLQVTTDGDGSKFASNGVDLGATSYKTATADNLLTTVAAFSALNDVKKAITQLASDRATIGANMSVLTLYGDNLSVLRDNISAANSRIQDVDVARESIQFAKYTILVQAGTAMLAQANASSQSVLRLLQ
jgi:flagellin